LIEFADSLPKSATGKEKWRLLQEREEARDPGLTFPPDGT
jgi:acyl-CoA synthetase (AMP-forming)/AMP-acid ligase II